MAPPADCPGAEANQYKPRNRSKLNRRLIDFSGINEAALAVLPSLLTEWLPGGTTKGVEYVARNPTRADRRPGSFKVNVLTGRWADFSTDDKGGDVISLRAYLDGIGQGEAARQLAFEIGVDADRKYGKDGEVKAPPEHRVYAPSSMSWRTKLASSIRTDMCDHQSVSCFFTA